ncbi:hypothetical protein FACS1894182_10870 [Bacteroidia bacterium]|nr:hypothetical protein FACS1894182_10870 [Bacteroidia bacterium]
MLSYFKLLMKNIILAGKPQELVIIENRQFQVLAYSDIIDIVYDAPYRYHLSGYCRNNYF